MTRTAPSSVRSRERRDRARRDRGDGAPFIRVEFPAPAPASAAPASVLPGVALVTLQRPEALNALSFALLDELADGARIARCRPGLPRDRHHRLG